MATITMDYEEFEKLKTKADYNDTEIIEKANREFKNWHKQYEQQRQYNEQTNDKALINRINALLIYCNLNEVLGFIKSEKVKEDLKEMIEFVEER
jgi:predicted ribosome quality control (RQC) complex YloA/Tae2 family protein